MENQVQLISLKNATISNGDYNVLEEVNLKLSNAEFCYLIGETGSGKSSLLKTIYAENKITSGKAQVLGYDLTNLPKNSIPELRRQMGMIFQEFQLFHEWSVARNLAYVLSVTGWRDKKKMQQRIDEVLMAVNMESKQKQLVHTLSGGEQQRLAIARSILNKPKIIIADEPTGNLDPDTSDTILFLLRDIALANSAAILVATHDQRIINKFPARVFRCHQNRLIELD